MGLLAGPIIIDPTAEERSAILAALLAEAAVTIKPGFYRRALPRCIDWGNPSLADSLDRINARALRRRAARWASAIEEEVAPDGSSALVFLPEEALEVVSARVTGDLMACAMADGTERFLTLDEHRNRWVEYTAGGLVAAAYDAVRVNRAAADGPARRRWRRAPAEDRSDWADAAR